MRKPFSAYWDRRPWVSQRIVADNATLPLIVKVIDEPEDDETEDGDHDT